MIGLEFLKPGMQTTIQDRGRFGYKDIGVTQAGAMDEYAFSFVNKLLGNPFNTPMVEIAFGSVTLKVHGLFTIAICGAKSVIKIDGKEVRNWASHQVNDGQIIEIGFASLGQWLYLGVAGGFALEEVFSSFSTSIRGELHVHKALSIQKGEFFACQSSKQKIKRFVAEELIPSYEEELLLHVLLGYQQEEFTKEEKEKFFANSYEVTKENNRMGYRLEGEKIVCKKEGIISEGIAFGSIQIPPHGQPIVLLKEHQTIGGYPKIGSVIPTDCFLLSQRRRGQRVRFVPIGLKEAMQKEREFYKLVCV